MVFKKIRLGRLARTFEPLIYGKGLFSMEW